MALSIDVDELFKYKNEGNLVCVKREQIDPNSIQGFILDYSDKLLLLQYVYDFNLDGLMVLYLSDITELTSRATDVFQTQMLKDESIYSKVNFNTEFETEGWSSVFQYAQEELVIVEEEREGYDIFSLGRISSLDDEKVEILGFSGIAEWDDEVSVHYFEDITSVQIRTNYINMYRNYFERKKLVDGEP